MAEVLDTHDVGMSKEYQTLFWVPMLFQTAKNAEALIEEMLDLIQDFHDETNAAAHVSRKSILMKREVGGAPKRRQQILGEALDTDVATTRVDVVMKSEATKLTLLSVLKRHFLFSQMRDYELEDVIDVMQSEDASEGDIIIQQGDSGELFYILEEGTCEIFINDESLGYVEAGSSFGDLALMYNCPRAATIRAVTYCTLWTLDRVFFRQAMVTSSSNQNVQLSQFLSKIALFASIGVQKLNQLARSLTKQTFDDGQYIIRQGDMGDQFYVIFRGKVCVTKADDSGKEHFLMELGEGEVFGERALIKKEPRKANIVANGPVEVYFLESQDFYSMLGEFVEKFNTMNEFRIIRSAKVFAKLSDNRLRELISLFSIHRMFSGQRAVCGLGEIFICIDGQFVSSHGERYGSDGNVEIGSLESTADEVAGSLTAVSDEGTLGSFSKELLLEFLKKNEEDESKKRRASISSDNRRSTLDMTNSSEPNAEAEREIIATAERRRMTANARRLSLAPFQCESLADVEILQPLGKGTFGNVFLVLHKRTDKLMALKCLDKKAIVDNGQHIYVRREIIALQNFQHPFITDYFGSIISRNKVCFLLEFIPGGELWSYLYDEHSKKVKGEWGGLPKEDVIYYAGTVLLALEHIHELGYIYRDLKPENLMIHENGYVKLVDFGFARQVPYINKSGNIQYRTFTLCGTPDYMAP